MSVAVEKYADHTLTG